MSPALGGEFREGAVRARIEVGTHDSHVANVALQHIGRFVASDFLDLEILASAAATRRTLPAARAFRTQPTSP